MVGDLDLVRPDAPLEFFGLVAGRLLFCLLLANPLILYGALVDVLHERGRCPPASDLVLHIREQTDGRHHGEKRTDHENSAAQALCETISETHGTPPTTRLGCPSVDDVPYNTVT
jgi:hypothetical protein